MQVLRFVPVAVYIHRLARANGQQHIRSAQKGVVGEFPDKPRQSIGNSPLFKGRKQVYNRGITEVG